MPEQLLCLSERVLALLRYLHAWLSALVLEPLWAALLVPVKDREALTPQHGH